MENKPRYSRISDILDLAIFMASRVQGITLPDIMRRYNVSRRTAERMRDSLTCIFPQIDEIETEDNKKHWGFTNYSISQLITFSPKEISNIEQFRRRTTNKEMKEELGKTVEKIKALNKKSQSTIEDNIELFMQTEGYAIRQTLQYKINTSILLTIRDALKTNRKVRGFYNEKERILEPLGLIYGEKIYLIAREEAKGEGIYNYLLHKFENLEIMKEIFDRGDFNLQEYRKESFGVYHGEIMDVELLFSQELAKEAEMYNFHPTQQGNYNKNGTYSVKFKASGSKEIIWHVFKWGEGCRIISPKKLKKEYEKYLSDCLKNI